MMLKQSVFKYARRKHGQKSWSPNTVNTGAGPANVLTTNEMLQLCYRPAPLDSTVEYEEDFGKSIMIHREYISKKWRNKIDFQIAPLAYSDLELNRAKTQLANVMNRERCNSAIANSDDPADRVQFESSVDESTREVQSARFLFNETRMRYCDKFQQHFRHMCATRATFSERNDANDEAQHFFSLMEVCAIIYGCSSSEVQEQYYKQFLELDLNSLEEEEEALHERLEDASQLSVELSKLHETEKKNSCTELESKEIVDEEIMENSKQFHDSNAVNMHEDNESVEQLIEAAPSLFDDDIVASTDDFAKESEQIKKKQLENYNENKMRKQHMESKLISVDKLAKSNEDADNTDEANNTKNTLSTSSPSQVSSNKEHYSVIDTTEKGILTKTSKTTPAISASTQNDVDENELYEKLEPVAALYKTYLSHAKGKSPIASYDANYLHATLRLVKRRRWRSLIERLVREKYHTFTDGDIGDAEELNTQLHTLKFFDLKVGDTVREVLQILEQEQGDGSSLHRSSPYEISSSHPERRV